MLMGLPMHRSLFVVALLFAVVSANWAMDGFSVTTHSVFGADGGNGLFGSIVRHDIAGSKVAGSKVLVPGPARKPAISPDGKWIAFIKQNGTIAVIPAEGGKPKDLIQAHPGCHIDFVDGGWIYYNLGGTEDAASKKLRRVNADSGKDEKVVDFNVESGIWRFGISRDGKRMAIDRDKGDVMWTYDLVKNNRRLGDSNSLQGLTKYPGGNCGGSMSPGGVYFGAGHDTHNAYHIVDWATRTEVFSFAYIDIPELAAASWFKSPHGHWHERNAWSTNSDEWVILHMFGGEGGSEYSCGNQILVNWVKKEVVLPTDNSADSNQDDCAGDLWVAGASAAKRK